jgi:hypothetical protein
VLLLLRLDVDAERVLLMVLVGESDIVLGK